VSDRAVQVQTWLQERADEMAALVEDLVTLDTEYRSARLQNYADDARGNRSDRSGESADLHARDGRDGTRLVFVAGQVGEDRDGNVLGRDDFATQARHAFADLRRALAAASARPDQSPARSRWMRPTSEVPVPASVGAVRSARRSSRSRSKRRVVVGSRSASRSDASAWCASPTCRRQR
jgi:Endoribonuclease L-PSP